MKGNLRFDPCNLETQSLACYLRILFKMSTDPAHSDNWPVIQDQLLRVCNESFAYFLSLRSESHRNKWTCLMLLIINRIHKMPSDKVHTAIFNLYIKFFYLFLRVYYLTKLKWVLWNFLCICVFTRIHVIYKTSKFAIIAQMVVLNWIVIFASIKKNSRINAVILFKISIKASR